MGRGGHTTRTPRRHCPEQVIRKVAVGDEKLLGQGEDLN